MAGRISKLVNTDDCAFLIFLISLLIALIVLFPHQAHSGAGGDSNSVEQTFCNLILYFSATTGKAIATTAVIMVGIGALFGKISWGMALMVAIGISLIFGGASIVVALGATGNSCTAGSIIST